jgi:xyloglucan-specific exo-beta-1,4-glucanase
LPHQHGWIGQTTTGDPRVFGRVYLGTNGRGILRGDPVRGPR